MRLLVNKLLTGTGFSLLVLLLLYPSSSLTAQTGSIKCTGIVKSPNGNPLEGVTVSAASTRQNTSTNSSGSFTIEAGKGDVLSFSHTGYKTQQLISSGDQPLSVTMEDSAGVLQDVVVIGYGLQRRADVTSSVATVKAENFVKGPVLDAGQLLQGKVAGLSVSAPSGDPTSNTQILLRGNTTLFGANSNPLILIDGIPGDLKTVAPEDIESVDVLKDGSAAAIYGVRGTNGVILITSKRAKGTFLDNVEYSGSVSNQFIARAPHMLTAQDYRNQIAAGTRKQADDQGASTDWLKAMLKSFPVTNVHNLTFRGGNSKTNYLATVNYRYLNGIFQKSDNSTLTARVDINHNMFNNKLRINIGLLDRINKFTQTADDQSFSGYYYRQALMHNPTSPVRDSTGHFSEDVSNFEYDNPVSHLYESNGSAQSALQRFNTQITFKPIPDLTINALGSYTRFNQNGGYAESKYNISNLRGKLNGYASVGADQFTDKLLELTAQYSKQIGDHGFSVLGGYSYQDSDSLNIFQSNYDFPTDIFGYYQIALGRASSAGLGRQISSYTATNLIGYFTRVTYNYRDKYLLLGSMRHEGASQFFRAKKPWGNFPAIQAGWRITKESFMENQTLFDDVKIRAGYGVTGNQPNTGFLAVPLLGYSNYILSNGQWIQSLVPSQNPNPDLRWEEKREADLGLDYSLFKGLISGTIDLYDRRIKGLLYDYQVPSPPNLFTTTRANVGTMQNKGIEVLINISPVRTKNVEWISSFNFSTNKNKLISLSNDLYKATSPYFTTGATGAPIQTFTNIVRVGRNIGDFYGFKVIGVSDAGEWIYEGSDGKEVPYKSFNHSFGDKKVLGNGLPKYYAGWNNNIRYKKLDISVTMRGAFKYQILNFQRMYYENTSVQNYNRLKSAYDKVFGKAVLNKNIPLEFNSYYIENGDFWKIDNITVGYTFSVRSGIIHHPRVYASTLNTLVITGYKGIDPEVDRTSLAPGNDSRDKYPTSRTVTIGISATF